MFKWGSVLLLALACCHPAQAVAEPMTERLRVEVVRTLPHDPDAFTQGLLLHEGHIYESTGLYGQASLRKVDPETGRVLNLLALDPAYFGEGLTRVGDTLIQLTWKEGLALVYDLDDFSLQRAHQYGGEGWGLCFDGEFLWMTDGSQTLYRRDAQSFELLGQQPVNFGGRSPGALNELECVGDAVYANIYRDSRIVKIDKASGRVLAEIDATPLLLLSEQPWDGEAVLNGIAYEAETDTFYLTGKLWPLLFQVRFVSP
ncbi:glutaminyl-peptide cyclotransferase [Zobellella aerophila]|uniref:Glutaminyl-peptide cyclotransferase n=1 Tax=Zobellella aerophila TaxID=870480 RepID=A0ABP6VVF7_9GAMM